MATLTQSVGVAHTRILSVGAARGSLAVTNDEIIEPINSSDEWIRQRTGIITRKRATPDVLAVDLAEGAGREAIERSGIEPADIAPVIPPPASNRRPTPSMAAAAAGRGGAEQERGLGREAQHDLEPDVGQGEDEEDDRHEHRDGAR